LLERKKIHTDQEILLFKVILLVILLAMNILMHLVYMLEAKVSGEFLNTISWKVDNFLTTFGLCFSAEANYFEVDILEKRASSISLSVGIVGRRFSLESLPGRVNESLAFSPGDGLMYRGRPVGSAFGPRAEVGDKIGCGIKFTSPSPQGKNQGLLSSSFQAFFTHNGKEVGVVPVYVPPGGFFPALSLSNPGDEISLRSGMRYIPEEDIMMLVDSGEDDWLNLHDIRLNGPILEYVGRGKSHVDVGLAQAKHPICTRHHYFEIEVNTIKNQSLDKQD
jgi:hypothetical protein